MTEKNPAAVALGSMNSAHKRQTARQNGRSGGRPLSPAGFWAKVIQPEEGCWTLRGRSCAVDTYQFIRVEGITTTTAHRVAWELTHGPIPDGLLVCHRCDHKCCVRPDHLFLGTYSDNAQDYQAKTRAGGVNTLARELHALESANDPIWAQFRTRAQREGHSLAWVLWQLIRRYVDRGLD